MTPSSRPAVERVQPPKAPFRVVNRIIRWLLATPGRSRRLGHHLLLLHVTGRRTGKQMTVPVAYRHAADGRLLVLTNAMWRANLRDSGKSAVTLLGVHRPAQAELVEDPDTVAETYRRLIEEVGPARAGRRMGIRINVPRTPTLEELGEAARRDGLSVIYLQPDGAR